MDKPRTNHLNSIDALRVLAILAVIAIHSSIVVLQSIDHNISLGFMPFFINQTSRFAVPLFFLISGFVLELNYREKFSFYDFFKKRASKVILPFLFWSLVYTFYNEGFGFLNHIDLNFVNNIVQGNVSYHLYFIPALIIYYIAFPILHKIIHLLKQPVFLFSIISLQILLLYYDYYVKSLQINSNLRISLLCFSVFILGMVASHKKNQIYDFVKKNFIFINLAFVFLLFFIPLHVFSLSNKFETTRYIYNQYHPLNYLYTLIFSALFFYIFEKTQFAKKIFIDLSKLSFLVFFLHVLIQYLVWNHLVVQIQNVFGKTILASLYFAPLLFIVITFISFSLAFVIHRIPKISLITG